MAKKKNVSAPPVPEHCDHVEDCKAPECDCGPKKESAGQPEKAGSLLERRKARQAEKLAKGFVGEAPFESVEG